VTYLKKGLKIVTVNILFIFIILLIYELIYGNWFNSKNYGNLFLPLNKSLIIEKLPYQSNRPILYTTDKNGFRANKYDLNSIDILVVGGSTTEEKLIDDNYIWTKILEKKINLKILNAGIGGQTSFGHVKMFDIWFSRFDNLRPNYIFFYIGINDALFMIENVRSNTLEESTISRIMNSVDRDNLVPINIVDKLFQYIKNNSGLIQLFRFLKGNYISYKYKINYNPTYTENNNSDSDFNLELTMQEKEKILLYKQYYLNNLDKLFIKTKKLNSNPIFITQTISSKHWLYTYLKEINSYTKMFCETKIVQCIYLDEHISLADDDFYDGIHTNPNGSKKIGVFLSSYFNK
jgi:hypothetical protein